MCEVLRAEQLSVKFQNSAFCLNPVNISLKKGEILSIIGESGSGKTTLARALMNLNPPNAEVSGRVLVCGKDFCQISEKERRNMRMRDISIAMQNSRELLNPMLTVRRQLLEILVKKYKGEDIEKRMAELAGFTDYPLDGFDKYPAELSGGMIQKVLIMSAIALKPAVVILDEPTSALDADTASSIVRMLKEIRRKEGTAFLIITHDLQLALQASSRTMVFYQGYVMEEGITETIFRAPHHPYTRGLFQSSVDLHLYRDIWGIRPARKDSELYVQGCPFYGRCHQCIDVCKNIRPQLSPWSEDAGWKIACNRGGIIKLLEGKNISRSFKKTKVLNQVDLYINSAEVVALLGPSGSGKSTLAHILSGIIQPDEGTVFYDNEKADFTRLHRMPGGMQIVRQDPDSALNPNMTVREAVTEPLVINAYPVDMTEEAERLLEDVGLSGGAELLSQKIKWLSGGQKQKVMLARALSLRPKLLIADEVTSMLDTSSKANLLRLLKGIQNKHGLAMLFITHDQNSARKISDRMYRLEANGRINTVTTDEFVRSSIVDSSP